MMANSFRYIFIFLLVVIASCRKFDENAPVISSVRINNTFGAELTAAADSANTFSIRLTDDEDLKQLKVKVNTLSGVHAHESTAGEDPHPFVMVNQGAFDTLVVMNINGSDVTKDFIFQISDTTAGGWEMEVDALDEGGNIKSETYSFQIFNPFIPQIFFANVSPTPLADGRFEITVDQSIMFDILVFANETLSLVEFSVVKGSSSTSYVFTPQANTFDGTGTTLTDFEESGNYTINITAETSSGRKTEFLATVVVE
jgi:hypothetical protein